MSISAIALIPARYDSSRFPGKLLQTIQGASVLDRVYKEMTLSDRFSDVVIVSGDEKITKECNRIGASYVEAYDDFICGTDRCLHGFSSLALYDVVVNVQADQPFIRHAIVDELVDVFEQDPKCKIASLKSEQNCDSINQNTVKVYVDDQLVATDFCRQLIKGKKAYQHIGVYGFSRSGIEEVISLRPTKRELDEHLEQLRWLEHGMCIQMVPVNDVPVSIDSPQDFIYK